MCILWYFGGILVDFNIKHFDFGINLLQQSVQICFSSVQGHGGDP